MHDNQLIIERFDRLESLYLTVGDYAALTQMRTDYPEQTRTLLENVLKLGPANDSDINQRFLVFFQDTTLQTLIRDVERQYDNTNDIGQALSEAFRRMQHMLPHVSVPRVYTQIGSFDQSIVVAEDMLGISLDKYLGADYPAYHRYGYTDQQRQMMTRQYIVPDCISFYLLSLYPVPQGEKASADQFRQHMARIKCVVNKAMGQRFFIGEDVERMEQYQRAHWNLSTSEFLSLDSF